jgi:hypothetical protein
MSEDKLYFRIYMLYDDGTKRELHHHDFKKLAECEGKKYNGTNVRPEGGLWVRIKFLLDNTIRNS